MPHNGEGDLGTALRNLRRSRNLSLDEAGRRSGASKAALSAWENGTRCPRGPALVRLLGAYEADDRTKACLVGLADPRHVRIALADSPFGPVEVGTVLRAMRERRGIVQAELAGRIGVSQAAVSRWEAGDDAPSSETLHALGFALGASPEETLALGSAAGQGAGGLAEDPEAVTQQIWAGPTHHSLRELLLLGWEAELVRRAAQNPRWDIALASVLSARACLLLLHSRHLEIVSLAKRATRLAGPLEVRLHAVPALGSLDHALRRLGENDGRTNGIAEAWAGSLPDSPGRAWMLRQSGLALIRRGQIAEGLRWVDRSSDVELAARGNDSDPWSHRAEMLAHAYLAAGDARRAAAVVGGCRTRRFPPKLFIKIEHANGRAVSEAEMAWLRWRTVRERWPQGLRLIDEIERRQARLSGTPRPDSTIPFDPGAEDRLWANVLRENPG